MLYVREYDSYFFMVHPGPSGRQWSRRTSNGLVKKLTKKKKLSRKYCSINVKYGRSIGITTKNDRIRRYYDGIMASGPKILCLRTIGSSSLGILRLTYWSGTGRVRAYFDWRDPRAMSYDPTRTNTMVERTLMATTRRTICRTRRRVEYMRTVCNFWLWRINFDKVSEPIILNAKQPLEHLWEP